MVYTGKGCISSYELKLNDNNISDVIVSIQLDNTYEYEKGGKKNKKNIWVGVNKENARLLKISKKFTVDKNLLPYITNCIGNKYTFTIEKKENESKYKLTSIAYNKE